MRIVLSHFLYENQFAASEILKWKLTRLHQINILFLTDQSRKHIAQRKKQQKFYFLESASVTEFRFR